MRVPGSDPGRKGKRLFALSVAILFLLSGTVGGTLYWVYAHETGMGTGLAPAQNIVLNSGNDSKACVSVTTCSNTISAAAYSVVVVGAVEYASAHALTFAVHTYTTKNITFAKGTSTSYPFSYVYAILYTGSSSTTLTVYVNVTTASYYVMFLSDWENTVVTATYTSGTGTGDGDSTAASSSCTPTISGEAIYAQVAAEATESTMTPGSGQKPMAAITATTTDIVSGRNEYYVDSGTTAYSMTNTLGTSTYWAMACAGLEPAAVPTAPTGLATGSQTTTSIALTWSLTASQSAYVTAAEVYKATYASGSCGAYTAGLAASSPYTSGTVTGLVEGNAYCFEVDAKNGTGWSANSTALTNVYTQYNPPAPTSLGFVAQWGTTNTLDLNWTQTPGNPSTYANSTVLYTTTSACGGTKTYVNDADSASVFYQITGLTAGTTYYAEVTEWNSVGIGVWSSCVSATTYATPGTPSGLGATGETANSISLAWTQPAGTVINDTVKWGTPTASSPWCSGVNQTSAGSTSSTTMTGLNPAQEYCFAVAAWQGGVEGSFTAYLNVTTTTSAPGTASNLAASSITTTGFTLSWKNPTLSSGSIVNVTVDVGTVCGTWSQKDSVGGALTSYAVSSLSGRTTYCVAVGVWDQAGEGPLSYTNVTTANPLMSAPTLSFVAGSRTTLTFQWTFNYNSGSYPVSNVTLVRWAASSCGGAGATYVSTGGNTTSWTFSGLTAFTHYSTEASGWTSGGESPWSSCLTEVSQSATPPAPTDLTLNSAGTTWISFSWVNPAQYTIYNTSVYQGPAGGSCGTGYTVASGWSKVVSLGQVGYAYNDTGLTAETNYCFEAVDWDGPSNFSSPFLTWTLSLPSGGSGSGSGNGTGPGGSGSGGSGSGSNGSASGSCSPFSCPALWGWGFWVGVGLLVAGVVLLLFRRWPGIVAIGLSLLLFAYEFRFFPY